MLLGQAVARASRTILNLSSTAGIVATALTTLQLGNLTLTADLIIKLLFTYAYTHGLLSSHSRSKKSSTTPQHYVDEKFSYSEQPSSDSSQRKQIIATVVGWREDEDLYRKCLESFARDGDCGPIIAGIDGDTREDEAMVDIFLKTFPDAIVIRLRERLSTTLDHYMLSASLSDVEDEQTRDVINQQLAGFIRGIVEEEIFPRSIKDIRSLCIVQPHQSKKDILFTALTFASVIGNELGISYVFSTDSDSTIAPGSLGKIITSLDGDEKIGGVSGHLRFQSTNPTYLTLMTSSHYWFDQEITKSQGSIFGATECQPGPCAAFRVSILKSILLPWYFQTTFGRRTVVNEDRHLTTRILWAGSTVHYAPECVVYTDSPDNFDSWVKQQVRWSRGTMIETLWYPWMINKLTPWHIYNILKARAGPLITFVAIVSYALGFELPAPPFTRMILVDLFCSVAIQVSYLVHMSPDRARTSDLVWLLPSLVWFFLMSPGIVIWSLLTIWDDSWGNTPRAVNWHSPEEKEGKWGWFESEVVKRVLKMKHVVFQLVWIAFIVVAITRFISRHHPTLS